MIAARLEMVLIVNNTRPAWLGGPILDYYQFDIQPYTAPEPDRSLERYKLIIVVDDPNRESNALWQLESLRAAAPEATIWFVASQIKVNDYRRLSSLRITNVLPYELTTNEFTDQMMSHFQMTIPASGIPIDRFEQVAKFLENVHSIAVKNDFIQEFLDVMCNTYNLYGATLLLKDDNLKSFSVRAGTDKGRTHVGRHYAPTTDLLTSVMTSREIKQIGDVSSVPSYTPVPVLPDAERALLIPLVYHGKAYGALTLFARTSQVFTQSDISIFSMIAHHFGIAYHGIHRMESERAIQRHGDLLLKAWERFGTAQTYHEIATSLHELAMEFPYVAEALIWLPTFALPDVEKDVIVAASDGLVQAFQRVIEHRELSKIIEQLYTNLQPITLSQQQAPGMQTVRFLNLMGGNYLLFVPIFTATSVDGVLVFSMAQNATIDDADFVSLERLLTIVGQGLERITYIKNTNDKQMYLESVLRGIPEGIFFLNKDNVVMFANPQLTELTGIPYDDIINQSGGVLFRRLAECDDNFKETLREFMEALYGDPEHDLKQRIIKIQSRRMGFQLGVALNPIDRRKGQQGIWLGIVRSLTEMLPKSAQPTVPATMFEQVAGHIRMSYLEASTLLTTLNEESGPIETQTRVKVMNRLQRELEGLEFGWEDLLRLQELETGSRALAPVKITMQDMIEKVLGQRVLTRRRRDFNVRTSGGLPLLEVDVVQMAWALSRMFYTITDEAPTITQVRIETDRMGKTLRIHLSNDLYILSPEGFGVVFPPGKDLEQYPFQRYGTRYLGLYLARRILNLHNSDIEAQNIPGRGTEFLIRITSVVPEEEPILLPELIGEIPYVAYPTPTSRVVGRVLMLEGKSQMGNLALQWLKPFFEVKRVNTVDLALQEMEGVAPEIIVVDAAGSDNVNSLNAVRLMREKTHVPIVMITDYPTSEQKIAALERGVDVYIGTNSRDEFLIEIDTVSKRSRVPENRTKEPLQIGELFIDLNRREVALKNEPLELTRIEYDLLRMLAINPGTVVKHDELLTEVWGPECRGKKYRQYLWVNMSRLRKKLQPEDFQDSYIQTRSGVGYFLQVPNN